MASVPGPVPTDHTDEPPAPAPYGWGAVFIGGLSLCLFATLRPAGVQPEGTLVGATLAGMAGATGVGLGLRAVRSRARPRWVAWLGLVWNLAIVLVVAGEIVERW